MFKSASKLLVLELTDTCFQSVIPIDRLDVKLVSNTVGESGDLECNSSHRRQNTGLFVNPRRRRGSRLGNKGER